MNSLTLLVRYLKYSAADVVEVIAMNVEVYEDEVVRTLRDKLHKWCFPLPQHYCFMHKMSVMFEKSPFNFHKLDGQHTQTIDIVCLDYELPSKASMETEINVKVSMLGGNFLYHRDMKITQLSSRFVKDEIVRKGGVLMRLFHRLESSPLCYSILEGSRCLYTYPNVADGDDIYMVSDYQNELFLLDSRVIVDGKSIVIQLNTYGKVKQLRDELENKEVKLDREKHCFVMVVGENCYIMDDEVPIRWYLIYQHGIGGFKFRDGIIGGNGYCITIQITILERECIWNEQLGLAYALAISFEQGAAQLSSVLLPVVFTLLATQPQDGQILKILANVCYPKWALEAFVIAIAERYSGVWLITRCGALLNKVYNLNDWSLCIVVLVFTGFVSRVIAFLCMVTFQKK